MQRLMMGSFVPYGRKYYIGSQYLGVEAVRRSIDRLTKRSLDVLSLRDW